ncbi:MAG: FecR domain-containing protein [Pseudomonadota bacterium]
MNPKASDNTMGKDAAIDSAAQEWFVLMQTGEPTAEDRQAFTRWRDTDPRHRAAFEELEAVWLAAASLRSAFDSPSPQSQRGPALPKPDAPPRRTSHRSLAHNVSRKVPWRGLAATFAAMAAFAVFAGPSVALRMHADHLTRAGEQAQIALPDGSQAWLNTDTAVAVNFSNDVRRITLLKGEAQFDVATDPQRPFTVEADLGSATAVGTIFTVREFEGASEITVVEGIVTVEAFAPSLEQDGGDASTLTEAERVRIHSGGGLSPVETVTLASANAWREGYIAFQNLPVDEALAELDRYRPGKILLMADKERLDAITARVAIDTIDDGLNAIAASSGLSVMKVTDYLVIVR